MGSQNSNFTLNVRKFYHPNQHSRKHLSEKKLTHAQMAGSLIFVVFRIFTSCFLRTWDNFYRWHGISAPRQSVVTVNGFAVISRGPPRGWKSIFDPVTRRRHVHWMVFRLRGQFGNRIFTTERKKNVGILGQSQSRRRSRRWSQMDVTSILGCPWKKRSENPFSN